MMGMYGHGLIVAMGLGLGWEHLLGRFFATTGRRYDTNRIIRPMGGSNEGSGHHCWCLLVCF